MLSTWPSFLVNLDYLGTCAGTCAGCLLSEDERRVSTPFLDRNQMTNALQRLHKSRFQATSCDYGAITFGRGNTLSLSDSAWSDVFHVALLFKQLFNPSTWNVECSTGLVGRIDPLIATAQHRVSSFGAPLRFVVAANSDLYSKSYWANVDRFFREMMAFRGGDSLDGSGDVLVLNLVADRLPEPLALADRAAAYPFPVNIAWLPPSQPMDLRRWMDSFCSRLASNRSDSNLLRHFVRTTQDLNIPDFQQALVDVEENLARFWWIDKLGELSPGLFTPFGDVDFSRLAIKTTKHLSSTLKALVPTLLKQKPCNTCQKQPLCLSSGAAAFAALTPEMPGVCPLGLLG